MSPKTKRNLSYVMVAADFFLMFIFALIMFEEMQDFGIYLFMLAFLGVDAYLSIDYIKEQNRKIRINDSLKAENESMYMDRRRWDQKTRTAVRRGTSKAQRPINSRNLEEEEEDLQELLQKQQEELNQTYRQ